MGVNEVNWKSPAFFPVVVAMTSTSFQSHWEMHLKWYLRTSLMMIKNPGFLVGSTKIPLSVPEGDVLCSDTFTGILFCKWFCRAMV